MLEVNKTIIIPNFVNETFDDTMEIMVDIPLSSSLSSQDLEKLNKSQTLIRTLNAKIGDMIFVSLSIKNDSSTSLFPLKLKIINDNNFSFVEGSLINALTKEVYSSESLTDNTILLPKLEPSDKINVYFYIKATFVDLKSSFNSNPIVLLPSLS
ncbi:MAG: hypothetical protein ACRC2K_09885, partial [Clostridium sp.]